MRVQSTRFIAASIEIIDIMLMPTAVLKAMPSSMPAFIMIPVSSNMLVIKPLIMARIMIDNTGQAIPVNWKKAIVPKSPIEQPSRHQEVLRALLRQVCLQLQNPGIAAVKDEMSIVREKVYRSRECKPCSQHRVK